MKQLIKYFLPYMLDGYKREFFLSILGMIAVALGTTLSAHLLKPVLDDIFINKDQQMLKLIPIAIVGVFMLKSIGRFVQTYYTVYIGDDIVRKLRNKLAKHLMYQDIGYLNRMRSGELLSRVTNDINRIQLVVSSMIPTMMVKLLLIVTLISYIIYQSPKLAFYFLVIMPLALLPLQILAKKMKRYSMRAQESNSDLTSRLTEIFNNIEVIKSNSSQNFEYERFAKENMNFFQLAIKQMKINALVGPSLEVFGSMAIAVAIYVGALQVIHDEITVGTFFAFVTALFMLYDPIKVLSNIHNSIQDAVAAMERMNELFEHKPTIISGKSELPFVQNVYFENVSLTYGSKIALTHINLEAQKGRVYALVGDSGAGKSSFVNLLVRFYDPTSGIIKINKKSISEYTLTSLHSKIAYVTQRVYIFQDTILANVAYGEVPNEEKVINALKRAYAWEFVKKMAEGIHTSLDEFGVNLSGGQRQRIALARALYKDPDILILDEATSALDNKSEKAIQKALENIKSEMITFIVAHRLTTIEKADTVLLFESGKIIEQGNYQALLHDSESFRKLANKQEP
ncbi:MAG: ABC transporter ATP-binding protein/permease [Sulfurovum sp.]|nr:ABC transporter ATP-binding protein/permease [Sulfurovum sp.]MCB4744209.1 ABC transporter ATP-binding protein/permease [Sulfurovum sp.]MCB4745575.1 ABC transporter ATP-binding protein/permease [Sulfurovum sp.]MCB4747834.1 ABC transporter ATP-binding protein/permease [Sulfurovum sp.]MCB4749210.1 ABC transporter ATP-binding protein/permease [Sulfurovum sp.]